MRRTAPKQVEVTEAERISKDSLSEQLVRACQDGCPEAQRELYERYKGKVYSLAIYRRFIHRFQPSVSSRSQFHTIAPVARRSVRRRRDEHEQPVVERPLNNFVKHEVGYDP